MTDMTESALASAWAPRNTHVHSIRRCEHARTGDEIHWLCGMHPVYTNRATADAIDVEEICIHCGEQIYQPSPGAPWRTVYVLSADTEICRARCDAEGVVSSGFVHVAVPRRLSGHSDPDATDVADHDEHEELEAQQPSRYFDAHDELEPS